VKAKLPKVVLRLGSHAEKGSFEKLAKSLDGLIFGGNLLEITPAATCSLIFALAAKRGGRALPFYLDPMTYCFGPYIDPQTGRVQTDLEALKSERLEKRGSKKKFKAVKESYASLADQLGPIFQAAVKNSRAIDPSTISPADRDKLCQAVVEYQLNRVAGILSGDELMASFVTGAKPAAVFAPYFFVHDKWLDAGLKAALDLAARTAALGPPRPVHAIVCVSPSVLCNAARVKYLIDELPKTNVAGVWFWFDGFDESLASLDQLHAFRQIIQGLSGKLEVYNLHGGYFSLLLALDGLAGISHGVGYGERKPVAQVIAPAAPTVRYYLPAIWKRVGVPDVQRSFPDVGITSAAEFFAKVCDCQICKGVIGDDLAQFRSFGQMHRANPTAQRDTQTPAAAKMCRFHFLINRFRERAVVAKLSAAERSQHVADMATPWRNCYPLRQYLGEQGTDGYTELWAQALS
jgi:hypothetical protein